MDYQRLLSSVGRQLQDSAIRRMGTVVATRHNLVSFAPGYPDATLFPWDELREIAGGLLTGSDPSALQYGPTRGYPPLLESLVDVMAARGIVTGAERLLITSGSQQAVDLIARVLVDPGDIVLVELPTFTGGIAAFRNVGADLVGVPVSPDGLDLENLDLVWDRSKGAGRCVKLLYLIPNFQNPTGALLSLEKRRRLIEWAEYRDVLVLEDDPYGTLYFDDADAPTTRPIRADAPDGRVLYTSSFSKALAPGFRVAWIEAPASLLDRLETAKQSVDLTSGILDQRIAHEAIRRHLIERIAPSLRARYREKCQTMEAAIRREMNGQLSWHTPRGGFFLWATLPAGCTDNELFARALEQHVVFVVGSAFHVDGSGHDTIRLSYSEPTLEQIDEGIRRLARAMPHRSSSGRSTE
jgi:DNA-binding transcriptional MocR family regulator